MTRLEEENEIPRDTIEGRRTYATINLALNKKTISDAENIKEFPTETICADTTNY